MIQGRNKPNDPTEAVTIDFQQPRTLSVNQAAAYSGLGQHTIRDVIAAGVLKAIRIGKNIRVAVTELDRFIAEAGAEGMDLGELRLQRRGSWPSEPHARAKRRARSTKR